MPECLTRAVLAVIHYRLCRLPLASKRTEAEVSCAHFLTRMDDAFDAIWLALPPDLRYRVQPFRNNARQMCLRLGATPNPDLVLDDHLDHLQECLVLTSHVLDHKMAYAHAA